MADQHLVFLSMPVVKSISLAIAVILTVGALSFFCPASVSEGFKLGLPRLIKVVVVNVSLGKGSVNIGAC